MNMFRLLLALVLMAAAGTPGLARAAQSYNGCTGFIDSLPVTISTPGIWCLRANLSTGIASGAAITLAADAITLDCNDFKIGGLAAGPGSTALGVLAENRKGATVRHCGIRGFHTGIALHGDGHVVEGNRVDNSLAYGILMAGTGHCVRRNRVIDTGGANGSAASVGIVSDGDVLDNVVSGVFATAADSGSTGIVVRGDGMQVRGNQVTRLAVSGNGQAFGIRVEEATGVVVEHNQLVAGVAAAGVGIAAGGSPQTFCIANTVAAFATSIASCTQLQDNLATN